ncbi:hypothetical protein HYX04_05240 [Candidatus Woesearchaeota archaeon]|nr:hypothetical protein [Candidatus Woesearchaeota archaeon]
MPAILKIKPPSPLLIFKKEIIFKLFAILMDVYFITHILERIFLYAVKPAENSKCLSEIQRKTGL